jgi:chemotaxis protein MotA
MDLATIVGITLALGAIFGTVIMEGGNVMAIILIPPMILVFAGSIGAAVAGGLMADALATPKTLIRAFTGKPPKPGEVVGVIVELAGRARREGLLALESAAAEIEDPFLKRGLQLAIDGTDAEEVASILSSEVETKRAADTAAAKIFADMGAYAPTIGIIGTVMGLVKVLSNLGSPTELGREIASAFVATLWGVMSANVIWLPVGTRLKRLSALECQQMELVIEGILAIQSGYNPRLVEQKLNSLLPPALQQADRDAA